MVYSKINMATDSDVLTIAKKTDKYK